MREWQVRLDGLVAAEIRKLCGTGAERKLYVLIAIEMPMEEVYIVS